ncbi:MAG: outer membrane beta-barrel protein [Ignavibacteria bacterium]|nr:outer membrane beta-barrel protein [Ignavibacteria bacterium]
MKTFLVILLLLIISSVGNSQSKYPYWSVNVTGGGTLPVGSFGDGYNVGGNAGVDVVYHIDPYWAVFGNGTYNFLKMKNLGSSSPSSSYIEATVGPRYYFSQKKVKAYGDVGVGLYTFHQGSYTSGTISIPSDSHSDFGMNIGAGVEVPISKEIDFVGKVKYHVIFTEVKTTNYGGIYGGINFRIP